MGRSKKRMEQEKLPLGTIYQVKDGGNYYLRYQIQGRRKNVNLKTDDYDEALKEYNRLLPTLQATTVEIVAAHVKNARQLGGRVKSVTLGGAWEKYSASPDRAMPATVSEQLAYEITYREFVDFIGDPLREIHTITYGDELKFTEQMKKRGYAVDTHNRKVKRLRKIFNVLVEYRNGAENPFVSKTLLRKPREEQDVGVRRMSFTHEQEKALMDGIFTSAPSQQTQQTTSAAPPPVVNGGISPKQLATLRKNPQWEKDQICERYHVPSLEGLTKQQASEAIKDSIDRRAQEKQ